MASIKSVFGTDEDEYGATLFVSHHIEELDSDYWVKHLGSANPNPVDVLKLLRSDGPDEDGDFDFTLPEDVTDYVLSVRFAEAGQVESISMES